MILEQTDTQKSRGGMTDEYLQSGTYVKSFYSVIGMPSACKVQLLNSQNPRLHHFVESNFLHQKYCVKV